MYDAHGKFLQNVSTNSSHRSQNYFLSTNSLLVYRGIFWCLFQWYSAWFCVLAFRICFSEYGMALQCFTCVPSRIIFFHVWCADLTWFDTAENVCLLCTGMAVHTTLLRGTSPELIGKSCCFKWGLASVLCSFALATLKRNLLWDTCPLGSGIHGRYCLKTSGYRS